MNAQETLIKTGIPSSFAVWRSEDGRVDPPEAYITHTQMRVEESHADDSVQEHRLFAYVNLWCKGNPNALAAKVRAAMYADGWSMAEEQQEYVHEAKMNRVSWTWTITEDAQDAAGH